jgi:hypothetical protein
MSCLMRCSPRKMARPSPVWFAETKHTTGHIICYENRDIFTCQEWYRAWRSVSEVRGNIHGPKAPSLNCDSLTYTVRDTIDCTPNPRAVSAYMVRRKLKSRLGVSAPDQRPME